MKSENFFKRFLHSQWLIPIIALLLLLLFNFIADIAMGRLISDNSFFSILMKTNNDGNPVISGNLISILNNGTEIVLLAIGMTLVTAATGGQDISVGAIVALAGSVLFAILGGGAVNISEFVAPVILAFVVCLVVAMACGAFNGVLVSVFKIPPMVATLILYIAGRKIANAVNQTGNMTTNVASYKVFGGVIPGCPIPTPILITILFGVIMALVMKFTNLKLYTQSVGINEKSARLNGINPVFIKILAFVILGICAAVCALIATSRNQLLNCEQICKDIEMDAILAVALGGNALSGGKFNIWTSIVGGYVIQILTVTLFRFGVPSSAISAFKAVVIIILVVVSAPAVVSKISALSAKKKAKGV